MNVHQDIRLIVDGDACPVKELVWRAALRLGMPMILVSNRPMAFGREQGVTEILVDGGPDAADRWIAAEAGPRDLVITADIPLAAAVVEKGGLALGHRGETFDADTIGERMATWALLRSLREAGLETSGPRPYGPKDRSNFSAALERLLRRLAAKKA